MFAAILQLLASALGLWLGAAMGRWWLALAAALACWLLALLAIGAVGLIVGGPSATPVKRFGER